jgi:glycosyltransferase involved in cell wall biosynthesis
VTPLRIAAHNGAPEFGGAEIATSLLLAGLQERGHDVVLFYNRDIVARGARAHGIETRHAHLGGDIAVHHALRFAWRLRRWRPDVLIVGTFRKLWLAALAARLAGVRPVIARIGLSTDVPRNAKYRFVFRHMVDRVVVNAHDLRRAYEIALPSAPPPLVLTVHKGVEAPAAVPDREEVRRELGVPAGARVIGGVGRLVEQKRFDRLLDAFATLPPDVYCVVVGEGALRESLETRAATLGVADRVRFTGHREDVAGVMAALDLLVISSDRESLANVMLEALAVGVPVVSTPVSGAAEALDGGEAIGPAADPEAPGVVVEPDGLAEAVASLLSDASRLQRMSRAARARAESRFGRERMLDEWEAALRGAASRGRAERVSAEPARSGDRGVES